MTQYIKKADVVEEIEACYNECLKRAKIIDAEYWNGKADAYRNMLNVLDTLEVKDIDETIKNAEDHAYFAGSENTREKLIDKACKWWEVELTYPSMTPEEFKLYKRKVRRFRKDMEDET